jgi:hypothetical protein
MGIDEVSDFVGGLLRLSGIATAQDDDMVVHEVDLVSDSVDGVAASRGSA